MLWRLLESMFNCCELEDSLPGLIVQKWKLSMLAESTCENFNNTVLPFTLEAKGTETCYFQLHQDFRLTKILTEPAVILVWQEPNMNLWDLINQ